MYVCVYIYIYGVKSSELLLLISINSITSIIIISIIMGVGSNNWFDRGLLPTLHMLKALTSTDVQTPFLGTP